MEPYERAENKTDVKDDPKARETLREAFEKTARWQADVQGFSADTLGIVVEHRARSPDRRRPGAAGRLRSRFG